jgi:hypothetical protein
MLFTRQGLSRRHRIFIFCYVLVSVLGITAWCEGSGGAPAPPPALNRAAPRRAASRRAMGRAMRWSDSVRSNWPLAPSGPKPAWFWNFFFCVTMALPSSCRLKSELPALSARSAPT